MDISDTLAPNSDQLDAVDLLSGARTFTITKVTKGNAEQPVNIHLAEFDRPWRPGKSMRRVLVACWGADASTYVGRRVTLFCDPDVKFGGEAVGGTRISALSHIDKPKTIPLLVTRGKSAPYRVQPLVDAAPESPGVSLAQRIDAAVAAFGRGGVTPEQLERRVGRARREWTARDVADLQALFEALRRQETTKEAAFPAVPPPPDPVVSTDDGWREPDPGDGGQGALPVDPPGDEGWPEVAPPGAGARA